MQPSFLHFYLFRTRQHNTSFLLTSKDELEYTREGGVFPKQPKLLSIRPTTCPPQEQFKIVLTPLASYPQLELEPSVASGYIFVWHQPASCGRAHLPPSPNSTTSTGKGDIPISSTGGTCFAVLPVIYTGASLDWWFGRGSICYI